MSEPSNISPQRKTLYETNYWQTKEISQKESASDDDDALVTRATQVIRKNYTNQDLRFLYRADWRVTPLIKTPRMIDANLNSFINKIKYDQALRNSLFGLCKKYSDSSSNSEISQSKQNIKNNLNTDLHQFIETINKKTIQDLIFYPFVIGNPSKIFSPDTVYFFLTYNHAKLQNARLPCLTKKDYEDFASLLVADFKKRPFGIGGNLDELRNTINDDKKFIDLLVGDNDYVLPCKENYTLERIKGLANFDQQTIEASRIPQSSDNQQNPIIRYIAESITNSLLINKSGEEVDAPQQSAIQSGKDILINDIYNSIKNNGHRIFQISKNGDENVYHPELEELFDNIKDKIAQRKTIDSLIEFFWIAVARLQMSNDQEDSGIIITGNDQIDKGWKTLHDDFQRTQELLHKFKSVITNSSIGFFSQLERIFKEEGASSKLFQAAKGFKELFMDGLDKSIKEMKENSKANFLEAITFDNNDFLKPEFRDMLSFERSENIKGKEKTVYTFNSNEALKVIFELAMSQYEGNLKFLDEKDLVPNHKRNTSVPEKQDLPYLIFKAFDRIFNLNAEQLLKFKNYINVYQNSTDSSSKINRRLWLLAIILGPVLGAGTVLYNSDNTPDTLYKANPQISSQELARMPKHKQLINKVINMLPEKVEFEANGKKYSIPRNSFWIYEIIGTAHKVSESQLSDLIKNIIKEHPEFVNQEKELIKAIKDQAIFLGKVYGTRGEDSNGKEQITLNNHPLTPIKIPIPGKEQNILVLLTSRNVFEQSEESEQSKKTNAIAYSLLRLPNSLSHIFSDTPTVRIPKRISPDQVEPILQRIHNFTQEHP